MVSGANISPINIEDEIRNSYMDYAMSVIIGRALPDVRDGLKPVHRRILYAMQELGNRWNASYKKSARVVGDVIGKYHPHGDSAVYDALVRMAQDFNMRMPLVDGQGNFGSVDGDPAAAMRYTEVRMSRAASSLLNDIDKETVAWGPNYDDSLVEPLVLPTRIPNLLVNGSEGIAVGMATKIPPHNLGEVIDATIALIANPELTVLELMEHVPGPDFPTAGFICGRRGILDAYRTGRGSITMRARTEFEEIRKDRNAIIITELPFQVNKARLLEKIAGLVRDKKITDISDLRDESDRKGMRVVIELKNSGVPEVVLNQLFKMTPMQQNFGTIMLAIVGGQPKVMGLKEVLSHFIDFRRDVVTRRTMYELRKAQEREHLLEGLVVALDHIDAVIATIRASHTVADARAALIERFSLSAIQSQAILDMRLQKLTGLERDKIVEELAAVRTEIERLQGILTDEGKLMEVIVTELEEVKELHGDPRRSVFADAVGDIDDLELIAEEDMVITVSHTGYVKRNALADYREQRRGDKGKIGMGTKDEDFLTDVFVASTHDTILVFTTLGRVFKLGVYEIPPAGRTARGKAIVNLLRFEPDEKMAAITVVHDFSDEEYLLFVTRMGLVKRTSLSDYTNIHAGGIRAVRLNDGDDLVTVKRVEPENHVMLATALGQSIRFDVAQVRPMGRVAAGVKGITLAKGDEVIGAEILREDLPIFTVTENGYGKRTDVNEYRVQGRGGKGIITVQTSDRNGRVVGIRQVEDTDSMILVSDGGKIIRMPVASVRIIGRNTQGVTLFRLDEGEHIVSLARVAEDDEPELDEDGNPIEIDDAAEFVESDAEGAEDGDVHDVTGMLDEEPDDE